MLACRSTCMFEQKTPNKAVASQGWMLHVLEQFSKCSLRNRVGTTLAAFLFIPFVVQWSGLFSTVWDLALHATVIWTNEIVGRCVCCVTSILGHFEFHWSKCLSHAIAYKSQSVAKTVSTVEFIPPKSYYNKRNAPFNVQELLRQSWTEHHQRGRITKRCSESNLVEPKFGLKLFPPRFCHF